MGTLVAVRKNNEAFIASDSWNLVEGLVQPSLNHAQQCIIKHADSYIGLHSSCAFQQAFQSVLKTFGQNSGDLSSREAIYDFFMRAHQVLRSNYFMNTSYQPSQEFEWTVMNCLVLNRHGIFKVDSSRSVYEFNRFWAIGSGDTFALGAMHTLYDSQASAQEIALAGIEASKAFDKSRYGEMVFHSIKTPELAVAQKKRVSHIQSGSKKKTPERPKLV